MSMPGAFSGNQSDSADDFFTDTTSEDYIPGDGATESDMDILNELAAQAEDDMLDDAEADEEDDDETMTVEAEDDGPEETEAQPAARAEDSGGQQQLRLGIDRETRSVFIIDENDVPQPVSATLLRRLPQLRTLLNRFLGSTPGDDEDEDDDDYQPVELVDDSEDDEDYSPFGVLRRSRRSGKEKKPFFPVCRESKPEGLLLERSGEFDKTLPTYLNGRRALGNVSNNIADVLRRRQSNWRKGCHRDTGRILVPNSVGSEVVRYDANIYCGQFSADGSFYYTCAQDFRIRIYDTTQSPSSLVSKSVKDSMADEDRENEANAAERRRRAIHGGRWGGMYGGYSDDQSCLKLIKSVRAYDSHSRWTITDGNLSPANDALIYSSIGPVVNFVKTREGDTLEGLGADASEHTQLNFAAGTRADFGIWSIRFSSDAREIVAGANHGSIFLYDIEQQRSVLRINAHVDDVNSVCFADSPSSNVLISGSDDSLIKIWDRRSMRGQTPSGVLVGHTEGLTFVSPKGDNRYLVSNGKDQAAKLWDLRKLYSAEAANALKPKDVGVRAYDYRGPLYKKPRYVKHPNDVSVCTYTGHSVLQTLIRCHFSPAASTGQRYIYSGSADGRIHIWNLDGQVHDVLDRRDIKPYGSNPCHAPPTTRTALPTPNPEMSGGTTVRDVSWHPLRPEILSTSWESRMGSAGSVVMHRFVS